MRTTLILLLGSALLAIACTPSGRDDPAGPGLPDTSWTVTSISGAPTIPDAQPSMAFTADAGLSGSAGCNQYSTTYRTDGNSISVGEIASTLMLCQGEQGAQETAFLNALRGATTWRIGGDGNLVLSGAGDIVAMPGVTEVGPSAAPTDATGAATLARTSWTLHEMAGTADFARLVPTLEFGEDGTLAGFAGCNQFNAPYQVTGSDLSLGSIATTKMACERPGSAVEAAYLQALTGVRTWAIDETGRLQLGGAVPLAFAPA